MLRANVTALVGAILLSACGGGGSQPPPPQSQSIAFAQAGPLYKFQGDSQYSNTASGGVGTGAITYSSDTPKVATVDANSGAVTIIGTGTAQITAAKAADPSYNSAKASYSLFVAPRSVAVSAWVGPQDTEVSFAPLPFPLQFTRSTDFSCDPTKPAPCSSATQTGTASTPQTDTVATLSQPAMYWLTHGPNATSGIVVPEVKFGDEVDPGVAIFQGRLWVVSDPAPHEVWSSADGVNWRRESANAGFPTRIAFKLVSFNNALWVIGGSQGNLLNDVWTSTDGKTWTQVTASAAFPARARFAATAFNGRIWVSGGAGFAGDLNDVWSSADGANWIQATAAAQPYGREQHELLSFGGKLWIIAGWESGFPTSDVWSSADGATWTEVTATAAFGYRFAHRVVTDGSTMWLIAGNDAYQSAQRDVWSSTDGKTWTQTTSSAEFRGLFGQGAAFWNGALWVIGGEGLAANSHVWTSPTGQHWAKASLSASVPGMAALATATYQGKVWAVGDELQLWSSADGMSWTEVAHNLPGSSSGLALLALNDRMLLIGGWQFSGPLQYYRGVWQSTDGQSWSQVLSSVPFAPMNIGQAVVFNKKAWVFAGSAADGNVPEIWSSPDGANWTKMVANAPFGPRSGYVVAVYNNQLWVIGGGTANGWLNDAWTSSDGVSWKQVTTTGLSATQFLSGIALANAMCVYGPDLVKLDVNHAWCSSDGALWTERPNNTPFGPMTVLNGSAFGIGGAIWLPIGSDLVWQSADGFTWRGGYQNTMRFP